MTPEMDVLQLSKELQSLGIPSRLYSLNGSTKNERVCLERRGDEWFVSFYERGNEAILGQFPTEAAACEYMLEELRREAR
ncbi:hypothetical protein VVD49_03970 [Uliginosibacterium sp. H3]|uniref:Uncharacterized protein n=1 Tax=Uliginosibacterium silvisoli TaxID=3114758 RepID=A0ABU6JZD7_9RHOO|nr:hypothetical protein [Uliginosibacterium sp. H3]